jgi:ubiquitin-conjugating enzyme E2 G2
MGSEMASKKLRREWAQLQRADDDQMMAFPKSETDLFLWEAILLGPANTPYEGGIYELEFKFSSN